MEPEALETMDPGGTAQQDDEDEMQLPGQTGIIAISPNSQTGGEGAILPLSSAQPGAQSSTGNEEPTDAPAPAPAPAVLTELEVYMCIAARACMRTCTDEIRN
jgi:hypothetical protein